MVSGKNNVPERFKFDIRLHQEIILASKTEIKSKCKSQPESGSKGTSDIERRNNILPDRVIGRYRRIGNSFDVHTGEAPSKSKM
ncbi:hypothetical protein EVAR_63195_1 [Eumeta japonica]|uniref:Uncharacterized protein n=1 Tax=Eumeta variegata TaxID=151549 RepID=A0A4C2A0F1_EUMVA|nr:hypothetical protein EVAR_63195_1 [Eumeta japonica]